MPEQPSHMEPCISSEDRLRIEELRNLVKDDLTPYYDTPFNLLRWLQGHHTLPIIEISKKLRNHLKMRKSTWNLDSMAKKPRKHPIHKHWRYGITGLSGKLDNCIVNIEQSGRTDYSGMMESYSIAEVMRARIPDLEEMLNEVMELEKKTGKQAWILFVMDLTDLEYNKKLYDLATGSMRSLAEFMADHYVEMIKFFVPVGLPSFAYPLWTVIRPLLPERTRNKVRMFSNSSWKSEILELADADRLPFFWNDDKHTFTAELDMPEPFPEDGYYSHKKAKIPLETKAVDVLHGRCYVEKYDLKVGDEISWWISGNRNFGFSFFVSDNENDTDYHSMDQVFPIFCWMPGPTLVPLEEKITIEKDGNYKLWIDNSRAWWCTLTVTMGVKITRKA